MYAMGQVESGGDYTRRNASSGAYGKYQIMPSNWPAWAQRYLGSASASRRRPTRRSWRPASSAPVRWLDSWRRVAYWWLTGSNQTTGWSAYATRYVSRVMTIYRARPPHRRLRHPRRQRHGEGASPSGRAAATRRPIATPRRARRSPTAARGGRPAFGGYAGDAARYATKAGATRDVHVQRTQGRLVRPGRTDARQGEGLRRRDVLKTVDLYARSFTARKAVFSKTLVVGRRHTLTIVVVGTAGHPIGRDRRASRSSS